MCEKTQGVMEDLLQVGMEAHLMEMSVTGKRRPEVAEQGLEVMSVDARKVQVITWSELQEC